MVSRAPKFYKGENMLGAIAGDIIGSRFEFKELAKPRFKLFTAESIYTDDTVLTIALAKYLMTSGKTWPDTIREYYHKYPDRGYGGSFRKWVDSDSTEGYNSFGNGSAMRVSPIAWLFPTLSEVLAVAGASAMATHNHEEGVKGAQVIAGCIYLARTNKSKKEIKDFTEEFYQIPDTMKAALNINKYNIFDKRECSCQKTIPLAIRAFLSSRDFTSAIRSAVMLGGDTDTIASMTGAIAEAYYGRSYINIPPTIVCEVLQRLEPEFVDIIKKFNTYLTKGK